MADCEVRSRPCCLSIEAIEASSMTGAMNEDQDPSVRIVCLDVRRRCAVGRAALGAADGRHAVSRERVSALDVVGAEDEAFRRVVLPAAQHLISYHILTHGCCWAALCDMPPERFDAGDVLVVPQGDAYFLADSPASQAAYGPEEAVAFLRGMAAGELPSVVSEGADGANRRSSSAASSAVTARR